MRKVYFIVAVLFVVSDSPAQIIRGYGIKAGATISSQSWEYSYSNFSFNPDNRVGLNIGIFAEFLDVPFISIVTELNYIQKGMKIDVPVTSVTNPHGTGEFVTWDTRIDYINISAFGKVRLNLGLFSPYVILGPKIDFEINKVTSLNTDPVEEAFHKNIPGFKAAIGTEVNLFSLNLLAEILYDADFKELYENANLTVDSNSLDIRIGIMF